MMATKADKYVEKVGRRKTASARVRIVPAAKTTITVNDKKFEEYFPVARLQEMVLSVFKLEDGTQTFTVTAVVKGGGVAAQAEALRHGIARAMIEHTAGLRTELKKKGYLKRDQRTVERKKPGLRKARRSPQWSKR